MRHSTTNADMEKGVCCAYQKLVFKNHIFSLLRNGPERTRWSERFFWKFKYISAQLKLDMIQF